MRPQLIVAIAAPLILACLVGAVLISARSTLGGPARDARAVGLVRLPDGRRINLRCAGSGSPTVILEGGYQATSLAWYKIEPQIARTTRVCAYDRAGLGLSDPGPPPRDGAAIARDLDQALRAANIAGPFVMVGHSAGGLYVRLFADRRPGDVVGMVLVETSVEHQDKRFAAAFGPGVGGIEPLRRRAQACLAAAEKHELPSADPALAPCVPAAKPGEDPAVAARRTAEAIRPSTWRADLSEIDNLFTTTSDVLDRGRPSYGDMPLVVLTAGNTYAAVADPRARAAVDALWATMHQEVAARSALGSAQLVAGSSHMMILDRPDAVIAAIDEVLAAVRPGGGDGR